jgi:hypothetical protein
MPVQSGVYSFLDVQASISGPGGNFNIKNGGVSDESIRIAMVADKNTMVIGANGDGMHSLKASTASRITISLLKTGTGNAQMNQLYSYQQASSAFWGQNILTITNPVSGDSIVASAGSFKKQADVAYSADAGMMVWEFDFISTMEVLGNGLNNTGLALGSAA